MALPSLIGLNLSFAAFRITLRRSADQLAAYLPVSTLLSDSTKPSELSGRPCACAGLILTATFLYVQA